MVPAELSTMGRTLLVTLHDGLMNVSGAADGEEETTTDEQVGNGAAAVAGTEAGEKEPGPGS